MFDAYTLKARFYPVIIVFFPAVVLGIFYSFQFQSVIHILISMGVAGALTFLFSQLGRDKGKMKEPGLWASWGGTPTTQILRHRDPSIDKHTKYRYHQRLQALCPGLIIVNEEIETNDPAKADELYKAWTTFLISKTRNAQTYPLLLKENISYGFRRNLWGLKAIGIIVTGIALLSNYLFWVKNASSWNPLLFPQNFILSTGVLLLILVFWIFVVSKAWVRIPAFSYAERLCEAIEGIN